MSFYHCEASIVAFLCFQIRQGKYISRRRPKKILEKQGDGVLGNLGPGKKGGVLFLFGGGGFLISGMILGLDLHFFHKLKTNKNGESFLMFVYLGIFVFFV